MRAYLIMFYGGDREKRSGGVLIRGARAKSLSPPPPSGRVFVGARPTKIPSPDTESIQYRLIKSSRHYYVQERPFRTGGAENDPKPYYTI